MADWSKEEVQATVLDYLDMLRAELNGEVYAKAHHRRELLKSLDGRTEGAVERKHQNISAILQKHGHPFIDGYKPLKGFQGLLEEVVLATFHISISERSYPMKSHSWVIASPTLATKRMDKSSFLHSGTGVPKELAFFFDYEPSMEAREINLVHRGVEHSATLTPDAVNARTRIMWKSDFSKVIAETLPSFLVRFAEDIAVSDPPHLRFVKDTPNTYEVSFVIPTEDNSDKKTEVDKILTSVRAEGAKRVYQATRYERDPKNRLEAIRIHGTRCSVCGMDFGERYGSWGEGFIEVHHLNPLAEGSEQDVNPEVDLVPICPNCHRMVHRHGDVLTIEAAKELIQD